MFFREKKSDNRTYLQIVENRWEDGKSKQRVIATLGRLDKLQSSGEIDSLLRSGARFAKNLLVISAHKKGQAAQMASRRIGPAMIFERLWQETGCQEVIKSLLAGRKFEFDAERAIFLTVLHRLFAPGSDRQVENWHEDYLVSGVEHLQLHHLYRAMAWLGEELGQTTRLAPNRTKDLIEEELFSRRQDLFSSLELVFFDTTSIYFEGEGGETLGQYGHSKDHRPDRRQMVVGAVLDNEGNPVCCELWPGNTADVKSLIPVVDRLRSRFGIKNVCIVADRGMISKETIKQLEAEERGWQYILGVRMRRQKEVSNKVLGRGGRFSVVYPKRNKRQSPSPLKVKEVVVGEKRYLICLNEEQAKKDALDRENVLSSLRAQLKRGDKSLVGNRGYRKYLKSSGAGFTIDEAKIMNEARYDGKWVLTTNTDLGKAEVALKYKQLWMVENLFRSVKSTLSTRPIYHKCDETIIGHVFCSFMALVLMKGLEDRLEGRGYKLEWRDIIRDLDRLTEVEVEQGGKRFLLRSESKGVCGKVFQAVGVAMPPTVRQVNGN